MNNDRNTPSRPTPCRIPTILRDIRPRELHDTMRCKARSLAYRHEVDGKRACGPDSDRPQEHEWEDSPEDHGLRSHIGRIIAFILDRIQV